MLVPVILCGGAGSRLWPVSREAFPKPFMVLRGTQTLLEQTILRGLSCAPDTSGYIVVTNQEYRFKTAEEIAKAQASLSASQGAKAGQVRGIQLLEPMGKNTAPAIGLAAKAAIDAFGEEATLLVLPADHLIADVGAFARDAKIAYEHAQEAPVVTFGIRPSIPETGYGYLETSREQLRGAVPLKRFVEKPNLQTAQEFLAAGNFLWNSGMFCFKARDMLKSLQTHASDVSKALDAVWAGATQEGDTYSFDKDAFASFPNISIDYAVMEKLQGARVVPSSFDWSDIGSWKSVSETFVPDAQGNTFNSDDSGLELVACSNVHVQASNRLVSAVGVKDVVIVDTDDAILVADKNSTQDVKEIVKRLKDKGSELATLHKTVARPWGTYTTIQEGNGYKVKRIVVKPGASLSLQLHHHRSEHWVVVRGTAKVTNGEKVVLLTPNQSTYIPIGEVHRLENPGMMDVELIEVQCGSYLGEDDIVRLTDVYGRVKGN